MKKIAFMGSDPIAIPLLLYLRQTSGASHQLMGIISQPDRPSGRGKKSSPNAISAWAQEQEIPLFRPEKPSENELSWLQGEGIDLILVMAYGHILKKAFLEAPPLGCLNFHASLLPKFRGASPIETAIACGEPVTGISLMEMVSKMDAGGVLDQELVGIEKTDTSESLREKMAEACVSLLARNLKKILMGDIHFEPQDEAQVTYCRKISKRDGWIDFSASAEEIINRLRAFERWPGGYFLKGEDAIKIGECEAKPKVGNFKPGTIVAAGGEGVVVATGESSLCIQSLQRPGGKLLPAGDFLRGYELEIGEILQGGQYEPLVSHEMFLGK